MFMYYIYYTCHLSTVILGHNKHRGSYFEALNSYVPHVHSLTEDTDKFDTWSIFLAGYSVPCTCITLTENFSFFYVTGNLRNVISNNYSI